jgi:hypothetical protein
LLLLLLLLGFWVCKGQQRWRLMVNPAAACGVCDCTVAELCWLVTGSWCTKVSVCVDMQWTGVQHVQLV